MNCISSSLLDLLFPFFLSGFLVSPCGLEESFLLSLDCLVMEVLSKNYFVLSTCPFVTIFLAPLHPLLSKALPACYWSANYVYAEHPGKL